VGVAHELSLRDILESTTTGTLLKLNVLSKNQI